MIARLITIGNSQGLRLPKKLIEKYDFGSEIELKPVSGGLLLKKVTHPRDGWRTQMELAIKSGDMPEKDLFEGIISDFDEKEWTWRTKE